MVWETILDYKNGKNKTYEKILHKIALVYERSAREGSIYRMIEKLHVSRIQGPL